MKKWAYESMGKQGSAKRDKGTNLVTKQTNCEQTHQINPTKHHKANPSTNKACGTLETK